MEWRNNFDTVLSNLAQQTSGAIAIMIIPKFMPASAYGKITIILTLLSLVPLADLGLTNIYNRNVPGLLATGNSAEATAWDATAMRARMIGSFVFGVLAGSFYYQRQGESLVAVLVLILCSLSGPTTFFISRCIATSDFGGAKRLNMLQAVLRLSTVPAAALAGVFGWCLGQAVAMAGLLADGRFRRSWWRDARAPFHWRLVHENIREALLLVLLANIWLQVLSFARTYAAFGYPNNVVANYGLVGAAYQAVGSVAIAAFVPQTVKVYALLARSRDEAVAYVVRSLLWSFPAMLALTAALAAGLPPLFQLVFPAYAISTELVYCQVASLVAYPLLLTLGTLLVGTGRSAIYLAIVGASLAVAIGTAWTGFSVMNYIAAAFGQLLGVSALAAGLCLAVSATFRDSLARLGPVWIAAGITVLTPVAAVIWLLR